MELGGTGSVSLLGMSETPDFERWRRLHFGPDAKPSPIPSDTGSGIVPEPLYAPEFGIPGQAPYLRGPYPTMYRGRLWTMRQYAGFGTARETNRRFHYLSKGGATVRLSTAFDSVTLYGEDPHTRPDIYGKVGNAGVSIATLDDLKKLYSALSRFLAPPRSRSR